MVSGVGVTLVNIAVLAVAYPMYLHFLGYEQYGVWLVLSTVLTFAQLGNLGIGQAVMKLVAEEYGRNDLEAAQQYMASAIAILAVSGGVVLAAILLFRTPIVALFKLSEENARTVSWMLPYVACLSIYVFIVQAVNAMLSGFGRMDLANYAQTAGRLVGVLVAGLLLYLGTGIEGLLFGATAADVFTHGLSLALIRRVAPIRILRTRNLCLARMKGLLGFGSGVLGTSLLSMLLSPFNKLMLSRYAGVASIPVYEIAYTGSMQIRGLAETGIRALMPEVSRIGVAMTEQTRSRIRGIHRRSLGLILRFALPLYGVLILTAPLLLRVWLGSRFTESLPPALRIALVGSLLSLACVPAYYLLLGLGRVRDCFFCHAILSGINVLLVLVFTWVDGVLSLPEVLASILIATAVSSAYIIVQQQRIVDHMPVNQIRLSEQPKGEDFIVPHCAYSRSIRDA
jgi:O-antigen/teichoic acid export membrane protein